MDPNGPTDWGRVAAAVLGGLGGGGLIVGAGKVLTATIDRVVPSADRRLDDRAKQRQERADRVRELEADLEAMTGKWLDAEKRVLAKQQELALLAVKLAQLDELRAQASLPAVTTPEMAQQSNAAVRPEQQAAVRRYREEQGGA